MLFRSLLASQDGVALCDRLLRAGLPAGPVLAVDQAMAAPHTAARAMVAEVDGLRMLGTPIKLSRTPGGVRARPPRFGEHGTEVLTRAGYAAADIRWLQEAGVLHVARRR